MRTLIMAPGAGSSTEFIERAFAPRPPAFDRLVPVPNGSGIPEAARANLREAAAKQGGPIIIGGVSFGAHQAVRLAALGGPAIDAVVAVMPAWTGPPGPIAAATAAAAARIADRGALSELERLQEEFPGDWVVEELARAWPANRELVPELRRAASSDGPTPEELAGLRVPLILVALAEDPLHPQAVARHWADLAPRAELVVVSRGEVQQDRGALGAAVALGLQRAASGSR